MVDFLTSAIGYLLRVVGFQTPFLRCLRHHALRDPAKLLPIDPPLFSADETLIYGQYVLQDRCEIGSRENFDVADRSCRDTLWILSIMLVSQNIS